MKKIVSILLFFVIAFFGYAVGEKELIVLHTNDLHSQIEPIQENGLGGFARIAGEVERIRQANPDRVLLFNAGDLWQGTPYFNFFGGEPELEFLNRMHYDAVTLGNHEFDNGVEFLAEKLKKLRVPLVVSNYDLSRTPLAEFAKPYLILKRNGLKIGIIGLCVNLDGLGVERNYRGVQYLDAVQTATELSAFLKKEKKCDLVICLSHLGYDEFVSDRTLAAQTADIDLIVGGHTHTLLPEGATVSNLQEKPVRIVQVGKGGAYLGQVKIEMMREK